jgi:hypothetical protein
VDVESAEGVSVPRAASSKEISEVVAQVGAALRAAAAAAAAQDVAEAEDVAQAAEDVLEAREHARVEPAGRRAAQAGVAEAVVHVALVRVRQHRVGLGRFLELSSASLSPGCDRDGI